MNANRSLPDVSDRYGAPTGRPNTYPCCSSDQERKFYLTRVRINRGGYDSGGAYWGLGAPLWWACSEDGKVEHFVRAKDRETAKRYLRETFPAARFFR